MNSFQRINNRQLLKTLWEKKKLLITSNFSFSHNIFYLIRKLIIVEKKKLLIMSNFFFSHISAQSENMKRLCKTSNFFFSHSVFIFSFPTMFFLLNQKIVSPFVNIFDIICIFAAEFEEPKTGMCG